MGQIMQNNAQGNFNNTPASNSNYDEIVNLLKKLGDLKTSGVLTEEEFNEKKKELLNKIQ
jgi:hypothetical protein